MNLKEWLSAHKLSAQAFSKRHKISRFTVHKVLHNKVIGERLAARIVRVTKGEVSPGTMLVRSKEAVPYGG